MILRLTRIAFVLALVIGPLVCSAGGNSPQSTALSIVTKLAKGDMSVHSSISWEELRVRSNGQVIDLGRVYRAQTKATQSDFRKRFVAAFAQGFKEQTKGSNLAWQGLKLMTVKLRSGTMIAWLDGKPFAVFKKRGNRWMLVEIG